MNEQELEVSASFEMDDENKIKLLEVTLQELMEKCTRLQKELKNCRNELCMKCGNYRESYTGICDDCRYRRGGEWLTDMDVRGN